MSRARDPRNCPRTTGDTVNPTAGGSKGREMDKPRRCGWVDRRPSNGLSALLVTLSSFWPGVRGGSRCRESRYGEFATGPFDEQVIRSISTLAHW